VKAKITNCFLTGTQQTQCTSHMVANRRGNPEVSSDQAYLNS
jgi:hypothetical protein